MDLLSKIRNKIEKRKLIPIFKQRTEINELLKSKYLTEEEINIFSTAASSKTEKFEFDLLKKAINEKITNKQEEIKLKNTELTEARKKKSEYNKMYSKAYFEAINKSLPNFKSKNLLEIVESINAQPTYNQSTNEISNSKNILATELEEWKKIMSSYYSQSQSTNEISNSSYSPDDQLNVINQQAVAIRNMFAPIDRQMQSELLKRMWSKASYMFFTLNPYLVDTFILRNPLLKSIAGMAFEDAFSDFEIIQQNEELETNEQERKKIEKYITPFIHSMIEFLRMGNLYGSVVGVIKWKDEPLNNLQNELSLIDGSFLEIAYYNKFELAYLKKEIDINETLTKEEIELMNTIEVLKGIRNIDTNEQLKNINQFYKTTVNFKGYEIHESRIIDFTTDYATSQRLRDITIDKGISFFDVYQDAITMFLNHKQAIDYTMVSRAITIISPTPNASIGSSQVDDIQKTLEGININSDSFIVFPEPMTLERVVDQTDIKQLLNAACAILCSELEIPFSKLIPSEGYRSVIGGSNAENEAERNWKRKILTIQIKHQDKFEHLLRIVCKLLNIDLSKYKIAFEREINKSFDQIVAENNVKLNALNAAMANGSMSSEDYITNLSKIFPDFNFTQKDLESDLNNLSNQGEQENINKDEEIL
jgi:hypothetical protein